LPLSEFRDFLEAAAKTLGSKRKLAKAIAITPGRLSRVLGGEHSLEIDRCLTLAKLTGESPLRVLRLAGKADLADQIEEAYGPNRPTIKPAEQALLDQWDALEPSDRANLRAILTALAAKRREERHATEPSFRAAAPAKPPRARKGDRRK
jgi:plasmid maintenance system antidote protein VapI